MTRRLISSGSKFEEEIGYSRAVVDGDYVFVSGTTGFDYTTMTLREGVVAQADQCFRNIADALAQARADSACAARLPRPPAVRALAERQEPAAGARP
jgi:enamine deaminase RidA (YjgF/YER057c/UK114 family)